MPELLLGAGSRHEKRVHAEGKSAWTELVTLDINEGHNPTVVHDLTFFPYPFREDTFDEVHAYDVMEHLASQGDYRGFFRLWSEIWRIMKPSAFFVGISPLRESRWAWGDPGHTMIVGPEVLTFLDQAEYTKQVGLSPMTDYRFCYQADFKPIEFQQQGDAFVYILQAIKPSRITGK